MTIFVRVSNLHRAVGNVIMRERESKTPQKLLRRHRLTPTKKRHHSNQQSLESRRQLGADGNDAHRNVSISDIALCRDLTELPALSICMRHTLKTGNMSLLRRMRVVSPDFSLDLLFEARDTRIYASGEDVSFCCLDCPNQLRFVIKTTAFEGLPRDMRTQHLRRRAHNRRTVAEQQPKRTSPTRRMLARSAAACVLLVVLVAVALQSADARDVLDARSTSHHPGSFYVAHPHRLYCEKMCRRTQFDGL